ncbi:CHAT domain-containing protein [Mesorhizobium yinganensis]|uniref:CHAT domain-containing protein n=1 Tax=Mesorhizobium yinganensis TaxID=3157707 RepID=UPI0032B842C1
MTKKPDELHLPADQDEPLFFKAEVPPKTSDDRHFLALNSQFDRPGLNRHGGNGDGMPFFVSGISGVEEGSENAMRVLVTSGNAMYESDVERRLTSLQAAVELMEAVKDDQNAAATIADQKGMVLGSLAGTLMARREGNPEQNRRDAIDYYRRALQHFIDHDDGPNVTKTKYNMADAYAAGVWSDDRSDGRLALSYLREAITETAPSAGGLLGLYARLNFASFAGRFAEVGEGATLVEEAIVYLNEVVAATADMKDRRLQSAALNTLAALYEKRQYGDRRSNLERAIKCLEASLELRPKEEVPDDWSLTNSNLLSIKRAYAREFSDVGLEHADDEYLVHREQRISDLEKQGRPLLVADEQLGLARNLVFGSRRDNARFERGRELITSAYATFGERGAVSEMVDAVHLLHWADLRLEDLSAAAFHGWQALALSADLEEGGVERVREISRSLKGLDARVAMLFLSAGETAAALDALEFGRARFLRSALRLRTSNTDVQARAAQARAKLIAIEREVTRSDNPPSELLEAFVKAREELTALGQIGGPTAPEIGDNLFLRTWRVAERLMQTYRALIIPVFDNGRHAIAVLALEGKDLRASVVFGDDDLQPALERWNAADWGDPVARKTTIDALMTDVWNTFGVFAVQGLMRREVPFGSRVAIVPQGEFGQLPLTLARHQESGSVLGDMFEFSVAPSIAALDSSVSDPEIPTLAAIINPTEDLPFSPVEAINCRAVFGSHETASTYLFGVDCSKNTVLNALQSRSHWLFSAHGSFDPVDVRRSGLQLAGGEFLSLDDLFTLVHLAQPRLVMLSSCDTGHHLVGSASDEFIGLPLGFLQLGAGGVLATRWPVSDVATALFVSAFTTSHILNRNRPAFALQDGQHWVREATVERLRPIVARLIADNIPPATRSALQEFDRTLATQPSSLKIFSHPYYWGGFVLYGA